MNVKSREHLFYIDGLKGLSCLFIMIGHYFGAYKYAEITSEQYSALFEFFKHRATRNIVNESLWLQLFFLISGYLIASGKTDSIKTFALKTVKRFLRFYLPIAWACFIIYILLSLTGVHAQETSAFFDNSFFQGCTDKHLKFYEIFYDPIKTIFIGGSRFNSPYWMIADMFYSSIAGYALLYIKDKFKHGNIYMPLITAAVIFVCFELNSRHSINIMSYFIGMALNMISPYVDKHIKRNAWANIILLAAVTALFFGGHYIASKFIKLIIPSFPSKVSTNEAIVWFSLILLFLKKSSISVKILSSRPFLFLGKISFGIYSFHWPVYISTGALIMIKMLPSYSLFKSVSAASAVCAFITFILAIIYHYTFENFSMKLIGKIKFPAISQRIKN